jgi:hypothetical protein
VDCSPSDDPTLAALGIAPDDLVNLLSGVLRADSGGEDSSVLVDLPLAIKGLGGGVWELFLARDGGWMEDLRLPR